jgi:hypothetical protein
MDSSLQFGVERSVRMAFSRLTVSEEVERRRLVDEAIHSGEMEGVSVDVDTRADTEDYIAGRIDSDELVERARARYGLR